MHAGEQVRVLLDEGQGQTPTARSEPRDALPLLLTAHGHARLDLCELEIEHTLKHDAVCSPDFEKIVSAVPHDLFYRGICEEEENGVEPCECVAGSESEDVEDEDALCLGCADAHEGEDAVCCAEVLALAVDNEKRRSCEYAGCICDGGCVRTVSVSC